jgi:uncharacterized protein
MRPSGPLRRALWNGGERRFRTPWRISAGVVVFGVVSVAVPFAAMIAFSLLGFEVVALNEFTVAVLSMLALGIAIMVILWPLARFVDRRWITDYGLRINRRWWNDLLFGLVLGAALQTAIFVIGWLAGWFRVTGTFVADGSFVLAIAGLLLLFLSVGISEELLARGWLLTNLAEGLRFAGERLAVALSVFVSSVLFGFVHLSNPGASSVSTVGIALAGVLLATGYVLTGELGIPIGVHISWNFFQGPVFGLGVSGLEMPASFLAVDTVGPAWMTGGGFGPEAGALGVGAVILGVLSICGRVWRRDGRLSIHPRITVPALRGSEQSANAERPLQGGRLAGEEERN